MKEAKLIKLCGLRETHSHKRKGRIPHQSLGFWGIFFFLELPDYLHSKIDKIKVCEGNALNQKQPKISLFYLLP